MLQLPPILLAVLMIAFAVVDTLSAAQNDDALFGPNVLIVEPGDTTAQKRLDAIYNAQEKTEFGTDRYAVLLKPGKHNLDIRVGYYTQVLGLGRSPRDVQVHGAVRAIQVPGWDNVLINFWRAIENFTVTPSEPAKGIWGVSQATAMRRVHVRGDLALAEWGASSGGFIADSLVDGTINSMSQQQYLLRNTHMDKWVGGLWNMVFVGVPNAPRGIWPEHPFTTIDKTPVIREKPFIALNDKGEYEVVVPGLRHEAYGPSWVTGREGKGARTVPISEFHIARSDVDDAASINAALAKGRHLLLTPGIYELSEPLHITKADTIVYTMGYATLVPVNGTPAVLVDDVSGVTLAGLFVDAGEKKSPVLIQIGQPGSEKSHAENPIALFDIFTRSGGQRIGKCDVFLEINSHDVIGDNFWLWRADHGNGAAWDQNLTANGLVVNGDSVTVYGLFVEHNQAYQTVWNGEDGRVYMYQSEMPYDPPSQSGWGNDGFGYASYKVADHVKRHQAYGLGIYCVFLKAPIVADAAVEAPDVPGIEFHNIIIVRLGGRPGGIRSVLNGRGDPVISDDKFMVSKLSGRN